MAKYELSLTSNYVRDWDITDAVREFFQNALDQETQNSENTAYYNYDATTETMTIGNRLSVLSAKSLLLGHTSKNDNDFTVGQFGEGYKIATLVALRTGHPVTIYNYGKKEVWRPRMVKSRRYEGEQILTFFTEKHMFTSVPHNNLEITIENISEEEYHLIVETNLHLQEERGPVNSTLYGDILREERYRGRIYVNGLFITQLEDLEFGYDIKPAFIDLDRDRGMVKSFDVYWITSRMWGTIRGEDLVETVSRNLSDTKYLSHQPNTFTLDEANSAGVKFLREHGERAVPVSSQIELDNAQTEYRNAVPVLVSDAYRDMIMQSSIYVPPEKAAPMTKDEKLIAWWNKVRTTLSIEQNQEFIDIMGLEEAPF